MVVYELFISVAVNVLWSVKGIRFSVPQVCDTEHMPNHVFYLEALAETIRMLFLFDKICVVCEPVLSAM